MQKLVLPLRMELVVLLLMRGWVAAGSFEQVGKILRQEQRLEQFG